MADSKVDDVQTGSDTTAGGTPDNVIPLNAAASGPMDHAGEGHSANEAAGSEMMIRESMIRPGFTLNKKFVVVDTKTLADLMYALKVGLTNHLTKWGCVSKFSDLLGLEGEFQEKLDLINDFIEAYK